MIAAAFGLIAGAALIGFGIGFGVAGVKTNDPGQALLYGGIGALAGAVGAAAGYGAVAGLSAYVGLGTTAVATTATASLVDTTVLGIAGGMAAGAAGGFVEGTLGGLAAGQSWDQALYSGAYAGAQGLVYGGIVGGATGALAGLGRFRAPAPGVPRTLGGLRSRIDTYGQRALLRAFDKGLEGSEAGAYVDRYVGRAVGQLNSRLRESGSNFRAYAQYGRDAAGGEFWGMNRPRGTAFPDVVLTNADRSIVYSAWDLTFHAQARPVWNTVADNHKYIDHFRIREGFVREIGLELSRP